MGHLFAYFGRYHSDSYLIVFVVAQGHIICGIDAVRADDVIGDDAQHHTCADGYYIMIEKPYCGFAARLLATMFQVVYVEEEKVVQSNQKQEPAAPVLVDTRTGRTRVGECEMGTFWWDNRDKTIHMRRWDGTWLGQFCSCCEWGNMCHRVEGYKAVA